MSLLSSMGIPPGDPLLASLIEDDEKVREEMERHACPDCDGRGTVLYSYRVAPQYAPFRMRDTCPTCSGSGYQEGSHTVAGGAG